MIDLPPMSADSPQHSPFLLRRLAAIVYDSFLVLALIMAVMFVVLPLYSAISGNNTSETVVQLDRELVWLVWLLTPMVFFSVFWLKSGQTLSMQAWRIKLVTFSGELPNLKQCITRCLGAALSAACLGVGYWWCLFDKNGRCWHDYLSGTELVLLPKREKKKKGKLASTE
jgi:uncharacterized RDD family membrane protein YckC